MATLNTNISTSFSDHILAWIEREFLTRLEAELVLHPLGKKKTLPKQMGKTVKWNRLTNFSADTTALSEGVSPDGQSLSTSAVTATIAGYGNYVTISDYFQMSAVNDTIRDAAELLSYQAALSLDTLLQATLNAGGTQRYADADNNSSISDVETGTDQLRSDELKVVLKAMRAANVPTYSDGKYRGVIHPFMEFNLLSETAAGSFIQLAANVSNKVADSAEIGTAFGIKLLRSTNVQADGTSTNTYGNIFLGRDGFGVVDLQSAGLKTIMKDFGTAGSEDPLDQRATIGYKFYHANAVLEALRVQVLWAYGT